MNINRSPDANTHLSISLHNYVAYVQEQMKQTSQALAHAGKAAERQTKREQFISRHLIRTLV